MTTEILDFVCTASGNDYQYYFTHLRLQGVTKLYHA